MYRYRVGRDQRERCCVTLWAVEDLRALKGIGMEFKKMKDKIAQLKIKTITFFE